MAYTWMDGTTCSIFQDLDTQEEAEVVLLDAATDLWTYTAKCPQGVGVGTFQTRDGAKAAAERSLDAMRGNGGKDAPHE